LAKKLINNLESQIIKRKKGIVVLTKQIYKNHLVQFIDI